MIPAHPTRKPVIPVYRPPVVPCVPVDGKHDGEVIATVDANAPESFRELLAAIRQLIKSYRNRS